MLDDADLAPVLELAGEAVVLLRTPAGGRAAPLIVHANGIFGTLVGEAAADLAGRGLRALRDLLAPRAALDGLAQAVAAGEPWSAAVDAVASGRTLAARGASLPGRTDRYLVWLSPAGRPAMADLDPPRPCGGSTRECLYALAIEPDCRLRLAWADSRLAELTGYGVAELLEGGLVPLVVPADRPLLLRRNLEALAGRAAVARYRLRCRDGSVRLVRDHAEPEWTADASAVLRLAGAITDITDEVERAAAAVDRIAALVAEAGGGEALIVDLSGRIRRGGGEDGARSVDSLAATLPPAAVDRWLDRIEEAVDGGRTVVYELPWRGAAGVLEHEVLLAGFGDERAVALIRAVGSSAPPPPAPREAPAVLAVAGLGDGLHEAALDCVGDGVAMLDVDGTVRWLSRNAAALLDCPREAAPGARIVDLLGQASGQPEATLERLLAPGGHGTAPIELTVRRRSGETLPIEVTVTPIDEPGRRTLILALRDITVRRQTDETLRSLAYHDPITGLPNRLLFHDRLAQAIERARRNRQALTVMQVDLDRFKLINDSLGLEQGDLVLRAVADRLVGCLRRSDTVARLGADEFLVLLLATDGAEAAAKVAQKLLGGLDAALPINGHELTVDASIGIALFPHDGGDADTLLKNAVTALSRAKEQGRNTYQFYTDDMNARAFERLTLQNGLRKALQQREFELFYQPKVSLEDGRMTGVEALIRWLHPELGMVPPGEFIPLAEDTGLIVPIGEWVLRTACAQVERWHRMGHAGLRLAVNLSARQFQQKGLTDTIAQIVRQAGIEPTLLELELTESVVMRDPADTARRLTELTGLGITLSIDDFGTGHSSLAYLRSFPISTLKIDRSFVRDVERAGQDVPIPKAIIALARSLGLTAVAEGVETVEQVAWLRREGCDEMQGFLFSRPVPADDMAKLLREGRRLALPAS